MSWIVPTSLLLFAGVDALLLLAALVRGPTSVPRPGYGGLQLVADAAGKLLEIGSDIAERAGSGDIPTSHEHEISSYSADSWSHG